jgi:hypothetical protein
LDGTATLQHQESMALQTAELPRTIKQVGIFYESLVIAEGVFQVQGGA